jgi:hypothetical protein
MAGLAEDRGRWERLVGNARQPPDPVEFARQHLQHYALAQKASPHELTA